jgi:hypothetical protein
MTWRSSALLSAATVDRSEVSARHRERRAASTTDCRRGSAAFHRCAPCPSRTELRAGRSARRRLAVEADRVTDVLQQRELGTHQRRGVPHSPANACELDVAAEDRSCGSGAPAAHQQFVRVERRGQRIAAQRCMPPSHSARSILIPVAPAPRRQRERLNGDSNPRNCDVGRFRFAPPGATRPWSR